MNYIDETDAILKQIRTVWLAGAKENNGYDPLQTINILQTIANLTINLSIAQSLRRIADRLDNNAKP